MKAKSTFLFILICTLVSACFGAVAMGTPVSTGTTFMPSAAIGAAETFSGLQSAMRECPGSFIMERGNLLLFAWPRGQEYAFAILGKNGQASAELTGLKINTLNLTMMLRSLGDGGWQRILPGAVPAAVAEVLGMLTVEMAMTSMRSLPTIFIVPLAVLEPTDQVQEIQ